MKTYSWAGKRAGMSLSMIHLLGIVFIGSVICWQLATIPAVSPPSELFVLRTSPPPEVAIELSDQELSELSEAYEQGFNNPNPGGDDPCERLRLLPHKPLGAWRRQFARRGFTVEKIKAILAKGRREVVVHPKKAVSYTRIYDPQGNWIVVDFAECVIWQVAPYNFK